MAQQGVYFYGGVLQLGFLRYDQLRSGFIWCSMLSKVISVFIFSLISAYLGYHGLHGQRGYYVWQQKKQILTQLETKEKRLLQKLHALRVKVSLLQENIDPDLMEQYMWLLFRNVDPEKKVILCP